MAHTTSDKHLEQALAVRRGQKKIDDVPKDDQGAVRKILRAGSDARFRGLMQRQEAPPKQFGRPVPLRRAHA